MLFRLSRPLYSFEELAKKNVNKKSTFFPEGATVFHRVVTAVAFIGAHAFAIWYFLNAVSEKTVVPDEFKLPNTDLPNKLASRPLAIYRLQKLRRERMGFPQRSTYMVEIRDFERDEPYEFKGDYPKRWWEYG